jgi:D-tyrosyl-tRNA(Tyr) deacylase
MIALLQRVTQAEVAVEGVCIARIGSGLLCFIGVERDDSEREAGRLMERLLTYRVFADSAGRMNRSLTETGGSLLLVPQFTLAADTRKGARPSFTPAAAPERGRELFSYCCAQARRRHASVACGQFAADMQVSLTNDGPVTFWLQVAPMNA